MSSKLSTLGPELKPPNSKLKALNPEGPKTFYKQQENVVRGLGFRGLGFGGLGLRVNKRESGKSVPRIFCFGIEGSGLWS